MGTKSIPTKAFKDLNLNIARNDNEIYGKSVNNCSLQYTQYF